MKKAFIFYGGWEGHEPEKESARFQRWLEEENYQVTRVDTLDRLEDAEYMKTFWPVSTAACVTPSAGA